MKGFNFWLLKKGKKRRGEHDAAAGPTDENDRRRFYYSLLRKSFNLRQNYLNICSYRLRLLIE